MRRILFQPLLKLIKYFTLLSATIKMQSYKTTLIAYIHINMKNTIPLFIYTNKIFHIVFSNHQKAKLHLKGF